MAQVAIRRKGDKQCPRHNTEVSLSCTKCQELVCTKCTSTTHKHHTFEKISKTATVKKDKIEKYVQNTEKKEISIIRKNLHSVDDQIKENSKYHKRLENDIKIQAEKVKQEIDRITEDFTKQCKEIENLNSQLLLRYKNELESLHTRLAQTMNECEKTLKSDNNVMIIDAEKDIQKEVILPKYPKLKTARFNADLLPSKNLMNGFGVLSIEEEKEKLAPQEQTPYHTPASDDVPQDRSNGSTVMNEFKYSTSITSLEKTSSGKVWVSYGDDSNISLVSQQGEVLRKLNHDHKVWDISTSTLTGNLWICSKDNTIYEMSGNRTTKRFTSTSSTSVSLCLTPDDSVVVGTVKDSSIMIYSTEGQVLHHGRSGKALVASPHHIAVCASTGDIAVCDLDLPHHGGKDKPHVTLFNAKLEMKFQYYGPLKPQGHASMSKFYPIDVVYNSKDCLLIADFNNKCIQMVKGEGEFLTVVHTDHLPPRALTLVQDNILLIGFHGSNIKVIRYKV